MPMQQLIKAKDLRAEFSRSLRELHQPAKTERIRIKTSGPAVNIFGPKDKVYLKTLVKNSMISILGQELTEQDRVYGPRPFTLKVDGRETKSLQNLLRRINVKYRESNTLDLAKLSRVLNAGVYRRVKFRTGQLGQNWSYFYDKKMVIGTKIEIESGKAIVIRSETPYSFYVSSNVARSSLRTKLNRKTKKVGTRVRKVRGTSLLMRVKAELVKAFPGFSVKARVSNAGGPVRGMRSPRRLMLLISARSNARLA